ncbi:MAG: DUF1934 domain-containing protein [Lachnospiraceae bacterium]|nr:DUF1934 domain-containing protein [Lachnospiraceae bacterium]
MSLGIPCQVKLQSLQVIEAERAETEQTMSGQFYQKEDACHLLYEEDMEGKEIKNRVTIKGDTVSVKREGAVSSKMVFSAGEQNGFSYHTPYGVFQFTSDTKVLTVQKTEKELVIDITYDLFSGGELVSVNELHWKCSFE